MTARPGRIRQSKKLDQYFLIDDDVLLAEVALADLSKSDSVFEIGAGDGTLTRLIAQQAGRVVAVEKDPRFASRLREACPDNVEVVCADVLNLSFPRFDKAMGNLPYSISTPLTFKLLDHGFSLGVLGYQYEFARRMIAAPGTSEYSKLSVMVALRTLQVDLCIRVPRTAFRPVPEVDSGIVRVVPRPDSDPGLLPNAILGMIFAHRRKTLANAVKDSDYHLRTRYGIGAPDVLANVEADWETRVFCMTPEKSLRFAACVARLVGAGIDKPSLDDQAGNVTI